MEEEMEETLLPAESERLANVRHYGLLAFLTVSFVLMFAALLALSVR